MAAAAQTTIGNYLRSVYHPDREYVDGEVQERNLGEREHGAIQAALVRWFSPYRAEWNIEVIPELRVQVAPTRFRVPDICVLDRNQPVEPIITRPPLVCIEILSPEDRVSRLMEKVEDYRRFGVLAVWIVDPSSQRGYDASAGGMERREHLELEGWPIRLDVGTLFADVWPPLAPPLSE